ncbi:unnamed protein product [Miscanthus lutarioriparius]|uniref:Uncharacterized protein n=1 Tax=Miscanthus lutarioriparius TaxID=422564 RepID=A0A811QS09_9POAL|nr:unnamed protein product [Miscanthus lutarioriparius]
MAGASSVDDGWASANDDGEGGDAGGGEEDEARPAPRLLGDDDGDGGRDAVERSRRAASLGVGSAE